MTSVKIKGFNNGTVDLSSYAWTYKVLFSFASSDYLLKWICIAAPTTFRMLLNLLWTHEDEDSINHENFY